MIVRRIGKYEKWRAYPRKPLSLLSWVVLLAGEQHKSEGGGRLEESVAIAEGDAFAQKVEVGPTGSGALDGLSFAVKDLIDIGGYKTGCGNPTWLATHPPRQSTRCA